MALLIILPNEILIQIVKYLSRQRDVYSVRCVSRRFYCLFDDYLYRYNIQFRGSSALLWAAKYGHESVARKLLSLGANHEVKLQRPAFALELQAFSSHDTSGVTPLYLAAWKGHLAIVKLLLELGADPGVRNPQTWTPLYVALVSGHEKIGRTMSRYISNFHNFLVDSDNELTALHVASHFRLSKSVRDFLKGGADINARDQRGWTPFHHALEVDPSRLELSNGIYRYTASNCSAESSGEELFETIAVLMEFGAYPELDSIEHFIRGIPFTVCELGAHHRDERVRAFFKSCAEVSPFKPDRLRIGRNWISDSNFDMTGFENGRPGPEFHIDAERFYKYLGSFGFSGPRRVKQNIPSYSG